MISYVILNPPYGDKRIDGEDFADAVLTYAAGIDGRYPDKTGIQVTVDETGGPNAYPLRAVADIPMGRSTRRLVVHGREDSRKSGRPRIGGEALLRLGDERLARVDAYAAQLGVQRAEAVRQLVDRALSDEQT